MGKQNAVNKTTYSNIHNRKQYTKTKGCICTKQQINVRMPKLPDRESNTRPRKQVWGNNRQSGTDLTFNNKTYKFNGYMYRKEFEKWRYWK